MSRRLVMIMTGVSAGVIAGTATVFACTPMPSVNLSKPYAVPGETLLLTGATWSQPSVVIRWDSLNGPVLARGIIAPDSVLAPVPVRIPAGAQPGFHMISATGLDAPGTATRAIVQVLPAGSTVIRQPTVSPVGGTTAQPSVGAGTVGLIAAMGLAGLMLFGGGMGWVARSYRRTTVASPVRRR